jgi:hypothetical protein
MNIAFSALVAFVLAIPGIVFWRTLRHGVSSDEDPTLSGDVIQTIAFSLPIAVGFHLVWFWLFSFLGQLCGLVIDQTSVFVLLIGKFGKNDELLAPAIESITGNSVAIVFYFTTAGFAAYFVGSWARKLVVNRPAPMPFIDFGNWWYRLHHHHRSEFGTQVGLRMQDGTDHVGILDDFDTDANGNLTTLMLHACITSSQGSNQPPVFQLNVYIDCSKMASLSLRPAPPPPS